MMAEEETLDPKSPVKPVEKKEKAPKGSEPYETLSKQGDKAPKRLKKTLNSTMTS